jgi:hypothetical protein
VHGADARGRRDVDACAHWVGRPWALRVFLILNGHGGARQNA